MLILNSLEVKASSGVWIVTGVYERRRKIILEWLKIFQADVNIEIVFKPGQEDFVQGSFFFLDHFHLGHFRIF